MDKISRAVRQLAFLVAVAVAVLFPLELFFDLIPNELWQTLATISAGCAIALFLAMIVDPEVHLGVQRANDEMHGGDLFRFRPVWDEHWGIFGDRLGSFILAILRLVLFVETVIAAFSFGVPSEAFFVGAGGFMISMLLTLWHVSRDELKDQRRDM